MFFPGSGQAIKNKIQQSYNFLDPPPPPPPPHLFCGKKTNMQECPKNPRDQILSLCQQQGSEC